MVPVSPPPGTAGLSSRSLVTQQVLDGPAALVAAIRVLWAFLAASRKSLSVPQSGAEIHPT